MKYCLLILTAFFSIQAFSQNAAKIDFKTVNKSIRFQPVIQELQATDFYEVELPASFTYHRLANDVASIFPPYETYIPTIKAKYQTAKNRYIFQVKAQGAINLVVKPSRYSRDYWESRGVKGFVKDIQYNFPCSLIVKKIVGKDTITLRKIEIIKPDEVFNKVFDKSNSNGFDPFPDDASLNAAINTNPTEQYRNIETEAFRNAYYKVSDAVANLFAQFNKGKTTIGIAIVKEKKREADFSDLDTITARYLRAINEFYEGDKAVAKSQLTVIAADFEKLLSSNDARIDANVKQIIKYNLGYCNIFLGDLTKAEEWINSTDKKILPSDLVAVKALNDFLIIYKTRKNLEEAK